MMKSLPEDVQQIIREVGAAYEAQSGESRNVAQARAGWADYLTGFPQQQATDADGRGSRARR